MEYKLKRQSDFKKLFSKGKRAYKNGLSMLYSPVNDGLKVGISVSKKHGNAVIRNRIKRYLRAAYIPLLKSLGNYHIVFLPKADNDYSFKKYNEAVKFLIEKEKLYKDEKASF